MDFLAHETGQYWYAISASVSLLIGMLVVRLLTSIKIARLRDQAAQLTNLVEGFLKAQDTQVYRGPYNDGVQCVGIEAYHEEQKARKKAEIELAERNARIEGLKEGNRKLDAQTEMIAKLGKPLPKLLCSTPDDITYGCGDVYLQRIEQALQQSEGGRGRHPAEGTFGWALKKMREGHKVRRSSWANPSTCTYYTKEGRVMPSAMWFPMGKAVFAEDWEVMVD